MSRSSSLVPSVPPLDFAPPGPLLRGPQINIPIEKIFDACPGSMVVQRSMSNIAGRAGGTLFNSLEYAVQKWNPKLLVVMGESHSTVMSDAQALRRQEPVCPEPDVYA